MNPSRIGAISETAIAAEATRLGFDVLRPIADGGRCDLAFHIGRRILRVQCKTAVRSGDVVVIRARTNRRVSGGYRAGTYGPDEIDVIAAYCRELKQTFAVPITHFGPSGVLHFRLSRPRNGQRAGLHFADDYPLGAIAQLEERSAGSRKVGGSNPPSSTALDPPTVIGAHEFRNRFGWYMERAAAGEPIVVTHRGRPQIRVLPAAAPAATTPDTCPESRGDEALRHPALAPQLEAGV